MANLAGTVQLHYEEAGQGLPVVLIHGFPFNHTIWRAQIDALSDSFHVIAPDLRGFGESPVPEGGYTMEIMAADVVALLDQLGIERAVWVGHSMGGYVTMAALREFPDRVMAVGLVATHPLADSQERRVQRLESAERALLNGSSDTAFSMIAVLFSSNVEGSSALAQSIYHIMVNTSPTAVAGAQRGMADRPDSRETLSKTDLPMLVVLGTQDRIVDRDVATAMVQTLSRARLVMIEDAGHMPMVEQPEATTGALRTFLLPLH